MTLRQANEAAALSEVGRVLEKVQAQDRRLRPYDSTRQVGVDWLGAVPGHWRQKRLKHAVGLINDKVESAGSDTRYVGLEHVESWTGRLLDSSNGAGEGTEGVANSFQPDDVLFGKLRPYLAKVLHARGAGVCTSELLVLRSRDLLSRFLFYYLLNRGFIEVVDGSTFGSKMPRADWQFIGNLPAMIPPPDEQCAIAAFLDRETAKIDGLVEKKRRLIELLKEKRTALISRAVTKGLNPAAPMKPSGIDWLGDVPRHWDIVAYKRVCTRVDVGIAEAATHAYCDDGIPIIRSTNVKPNRLDTSDILRIERWFAESNRSKTLRAGDLVTIRTGYPGTTAVVPQELDGCQCFTLVMSSPKQTAHGPFFSWVLNSHPGESYFQMESWGSAQANISVPIVQFMQVPRPPITEQIAISEYLELETRKLDSLSAKVESVIGRLNEYRSALISAAVTGKIDVREEMAHGQEV